jgi:hypothetical protein
VAACLKIQVRIAHSCVSAIKINAKYYYVTLAVTTINDKKSEKDKDTGMNI